MCHNALESMEAEKCNFPHDAHFRMRRANSACGRTFSTCGEPAPHAETLLRMRGCLLRVRRPCSACGAGSAHAEKCISACGAGSPHAEKCISACGGTSPHAEKGISARGKRLPACGGAFPHAENVCPRAELALRMRRTFARMRSWLSARGERLPACGAGSPHAENVRPHAELALRMRKWASCGKLHFSASTCMKDQLQLIKSPFSS